MTDILRKEFDGIEFIIRPFDVFTSWRVLTELQKSVVPGVVRMMIGDLEGFQDGIDNISQKLTPQEFDFLCNTLFFKHGNISFVNQSGDAVKLNDANSGMAFLSMGTVIDVAEAVIRLNYEDFFMQKLSRFGLGGAQ